MRVTSAAYRSKPLRWSEFETLMKRMDKSIMSHLETKDDHIAKKLAGFQTAIAIGCYIGPTGQELLSTRWSKVLDKTWYPFEFEHREAHMDERLQHVIKKNYGVVCPISSHQYILPDMTMSNTKLLPMKFNNGFANILEGHDIETPDPSATTLRKTYLRKVYLDLGGTEEALEILSKEMNYALVIIKAMVRL